MHFRQFVFLAFQALSNKGPVVVLAKYIGGLAVKQKVPGSNPGWGKNLEGLVVIGVRRTLLRYP